MRGCKELDDLKKLLKILSGAENSWCKINFNSASVLAFGDFDTDGNHRDASYRVYF